jgi:cytochrome c oxidase accessory protein FixG
MASDAVKPRPKLERLPPLPSAETVYRRVRKRIHLICVLIFIALPFFDILRVDIPRQRFYFAGFELMISEFAIIFFALMFLMFMIAASAIIHGRIYCSYACPQMIFSEASGDLRNWAQKRINKRYPRWPASRKKLAVNTIWYGTLSTASVFLAFVFTSYFVEPCDLLGRLLSFDIKTAGGVAGAVVTLITFLDFTFVRQKFCTTVCPYGYLQGMLQDKNTLLVIYQDEKKVCIECQKCVRVCEMGIDIRKSPYQIECVHCGECIDACEDVLRRVGRPGLIHYSWGESPKTAAKEPWYMRLGFRDAKRIAILFLLGFYLCGLSVALWMRKAVLIELRPDRTTLYTRLQDGRIANRIRIKAANRSSKPESIHFRVEGLPNAELAAGPISLQAGGTFEKTVELRVPRWKGASDVNRFRVIAEPQGDTFDLTFIMPVEEAK